ncbi:hypothetical protein C8R42DRAFT_436567 [Lentinula raphanica]|nr:hypothetical protein C8R42DRAFT_436567 [Lentinula raphanica]
MPCCSISLFLVLLLINHCMSERLSSPTPRHIRKCKFEYQLSTRWSLPGRGPQHSSALAFHAQHDETDYTNYGLIRNN